MVEERKFLDGKVILKPGDCRDRVRELPDNSVDACVTDPPYALVSIVKRFGSEGAAPATPKEGAAWAYARASAGFMGKQWDTGETAFAVEFWQEVLRVLKPGAHLVAFSGTRTYHRMAVAIEEAGFEIRDQAAWAYGTGFPKSHNVSKAIDRHLGVDREKVRDYNPRNPKATGGGKDGMEGATRPWIERAMAKGFHEIDSDIPATPEAEEWDGWGTALKPAWEPIVIARKPLAVPDGSGGYRTATVAENVLEWGTGAFNIRACRIDAEKATGWGGSAAGGGTWTEENNGLGKDGDARPVEGRWPANIITDGSPEVMAAFPTVQSGEGAVKRKSGKDGAGNTGAALGAESRASGTPMVFYGDAGSAARFFYSAKADGDDRLGSKHPTVKPVDLMRWLVRLVCKKGGTVLDPFAGTGTTGAAAYWEGCTAILVEREEEYQADIAKRMKLVLAGPEEKKRARTVPAPAESLPLFGGKQAEAPGMKRRIYGEFAHDATGKRFGDS